MEAFGELTAACAGFLGSHFLMSHPLRSGMVKLLGDSGFQAVYSLVSLAFFVWMVFAFRSTPTTAPFWAVSDTLWIAASVLSLISAILFTGSFAGNPALGMPGADEMAQREPAGVFRVTRHPMMWAFGIWGVSHILIAPRIDIFILIGSIIFLALVGAKAQDGKKAALMGESWQGWSARTSYWPNLAALPRVGALPIVGGFILWILISWAHAPLGQAGAGIFRWLGG